MNFGQNDFIQYWAAFQLHMRGADPFDPTLMFAVEKAHGWTEARPLMMWNPPWVLAILSPILQLEFNLAAKIFLFLNIALVILSLLLLKSVYKIKNLHLVLFLFPLLLCLKLGQVSILITFATSLMLYSVVNNKYFLLGLALAILSIKPHLVYLPLASLLIFVEPKQILKTLASFAFSLCSLLSLLFLQSANTFFYWLERAKHNSNPKLLNVYSWKTTTLSTVVRDAIFATSGQFTIWPMYFFAPVCLLGMIYFLKKNKYEFKEVTPVLIPISLFTTPFGWIYDASLCLITQVWIFSKPLSKINLYIITLLNLTLFAVFILFQPSFYDYWYFYPLYMYLTFRVFKNECCRTE